MKTRYLLGLTGVVGLVLVIQLVFAHSGTPQAAKTGAPGEQNCTQCHGGTINQPSGSTTISFNGGQTLYQPGQTYPVTVTVTDAVRPRKGFQITALQGAGGPTVGTFSLTNTTTTSMQTASVGGNARSYVGHKNANTTVSTWTFNWTAPANATGTITFYAAGNATNNNNSTNADRVYTTTLPITLAAVPVASFSANDTTVCANSTVTYSNQSTGAGTPSWSFPGGTPSTSTAASPTVTYSAPGHYAATLIVTNIAGSDTLVRNLYVEVGGQPALSGQSTATTCAGSNDGAIDLSVSGSTGNTFAWSTGATNEDITGLAAGSYTVTVTSGLGCSSTQSFTVTSPSALAVGVSSSNSACATATGSATASPSGGSPGYSFLWSNGSTSATATALAAGTYTVTVTDNNGCTATNTVSVSNTNAPALSSSATPTTCAGDFDGTATVAASGGTAPFTYLWSDGQTTPTATNLLAGNYSVTVTDAGGCLAVEVVTVSSPSPLSNSMSTTSDNGFSNGSATASASGGNGSYTYTWSNGQTGPTASGLAAGTYVVTISDALGCSLVDSVDVPLLVIGLTDIRPDLFQVGPNPFTEVLVLRPSLVIEGDFQVRLIDQRGRLTYSERVASHSGMPVVLRPGTLSDGIYFLVIETSQGRLVQKVLHRN
jgi:PKD repeat protein